MSDQRKERVSNGIRDQIIVTSVIFKMVTVAFLLWIAGLCFCITLGALTGWKI